MRSLQPIFDRCPATRQTQELRKRFTIESRGGVRAACLMSRFAGTRGSGMKNTAPDNPDRCRVVDEFGNRPCRRSVDYRKL